MEDLLTLVLLEVTKLVTLAQALVLWIHKVVNFVEMEALLTLVVLGHQAELHVMGLELQIHRHVKVSKANAPKRA